VDNFAVFRPTAVEREAIREEEASVGACLTTLVRLLEEGHKLTLGHKPENGSYYLHLKEGNVDWDKGITVSCWHSSIERVFQMMAYAVTHRYSEFPLVQRGSGQRADDW